MCKFLIALDTFVGLNGQKLVDKLTQKFIVGCCYDLVVLDN